MYALRTMIGLVLACSLFAVPGAQALDPPNNPGEAVFCIYTDWNADDGPANGEVHYDAPELFTLYRIYLVLYFAGGWTQTLGGFEFSLRLDNAGQEIVQGEHAIFGMQSWCPGHGGITNYAAGSFNYRAAPNSPILHWSDPILILSADLMFTNLPSLSHILMYFQESTPPSVPGQMSYTDAGNPEQFLRMLPNNADHDLDTPVFSWNGAVPVQTRTWSDVKSLFAD